MADDNQIVGVTPPGRPRISVTPANKTLPADNMPNILGVTPPAPAQPRIIGVTPPGQPRVNIPDKEPAGGAQPPAAAPPIDDDAYYLDLLKQHVDPGIAAAWYRARKVGKDLPNTGISWPSNLLKELYHVYKDAGGHLVEGLERQFSSKSTLKEQAHGAGEAALSAIEMFPPFAIGQAGWRSVSEPVSQITGLPKDEVQQIGELLMPGGPKVARTIAKTIARLPGAALGHQTFSPSTMGEGSQTASNLIRGRLANAARQTESTYAQVRERPPVFRHLVRGQVPTAWRNFTAHSLEQDVNALPPPDQINLIQHIETRSKGGLGAAVSPRMQHFADVFRQAMQDRRQRIAALPHHVMQKFIDDYFPHMWKDPDAARQFLKTWGSKTGAGGSLKKRSIPTISDGIAAGLVPASTNPVETMVMYVTNMDRYIAMNQVIDTAKELGHVKFFERGSREIPDGWEPLTQGRLTRKLFSTIDKKTGEPRAGEMQAYAPRGFAEVWNNFVSRGWFENKLGTRWYEALQSANNAITQLELGLSAYHGLTMVNESVINDVASGVQKIVGGAPFRGFGTIARAPAAPVRLAQHGKKLQNAYLGVTGASPDYAQIADLLEAAGGRAVGRGHARDYRYSAMGSYWRAFRQGALKAQMKADWLEAKGSPVGPAKVATRHIGRILQQVGEPIFDHYIPLLKNGAFYENMKGWLSVHPNATLSEQVQAAREIVDSIDNRFGEMIQDNIFWHNTMKQTAMLMMRSYSWNMGTIREIGGGALDLAQGKWTPRAAYAIAFPLTVGTINAALGYLLGQPPKDVDDLIAPRTGGMVQGASVPSLRPFGRSTAAMVPERLWSPGYQKDVFAWNDDWKAAALSKMSTLPRTVGELFRNQDWKSDPIYNPEHNVPQFLKDFSDYAFKSYGPISIRQALTPPEPGSNIPRWAGALGVRAAPKAIEDPAGTAEARRRRANKAWDLKTKKERKDAIRHGIYGQ